MDVRVAVIGGGPGGLMAAEVLATAGVAVTVFEQMPSMGRKFLLAGRGGLNLTHTEPLGQFVDRYGDQATRLASAIEGFDPAALQAWCAGLGEEPFIGSSGRVFPAGFRATALLRSWLRRLASLGVELRVRHTWMGWADNSGSPGATWIAIADATGEVQTVMVDAVLLALGGASWPSVGSDGAWVDLVRGDGVEVAPLRPSNCGFLVAWKDGFRDRFAGCPLKNITLSFAGHTARGDVVVTREGIEGGPVYALSGALRDALEAKGETILAVDLRPDFSANILTQTLARRRPRDSLSNALRRAGGLSPVAGALMREATDNALPTEPTALAQLAKAVPLRLVGVQPIERAISSAGGVSFSEIDDFYMLRRRPGTFVAGEMLDWEAPTGGYLLQATFSTAVAAANGTLAWLVARR